jgi:hypothetical protein
MADTTYKFAGAGTNIDGYTNPDRITAEDASLATCATASSNNCEVKLSYNGGTNWTSGAIRTFSPTLAWVVFPEVNPTEALWSRTWAVSEFSDANFKVRFTYAPGLENRTIDASTFGFSITAGSTITGIAVAVKAKADNGVQIDAIKVIVYYTEPALPNAKTINGLAKASVKTISGLALASVKTVNGLN